MFNLESKYEEILCGQTQNVEHSISLLAWTLQKCHYENKRRQRNCSRLKEWQWALTIKGSLSTLNGAWTEGWRVTNSYERCFWNNLKFEYGIYFRWHCIELMLIFFFGCDNFPNYSFYFRNNSSNCFVFIIMAKRQSQLTYRLSHACWSIWEWSIFIFVSYFQMAQQSRKERRESTCTHRNIGTCVCMCLHVLFRKVTNVEIRSNLLI